MGLLHFYAKLGFAFTAPSPDAQNPAAAVNSVPVGIFGKGGWCSAGTSSNVILRPSPNVEGSSDNFSSCLTQAGSGLTTVLPLPPNTSGATTTLLHCPALPAKLTSLLSGRATGLNWTVSARITLQSALVADGLQTAVTHGLHTVSFAHGLQTAFCARVTGRFSRNEGYRPLRSRSV